MILQEELNMKIQLDTFKSWRSIRKCLDKQVCDDMIKEIITAGKDIFDSMGNKLLSFTVIHDKEEMNKLNKITKIDMTEKSSVNIVKKLGKTPDFDIFYGAPTAIMISVKDQTKTIGDKIGGVVYKIVSAAKDCGLVTNCNSFIKYHFTDGVDTVEKEKLNIPPDFTPYCVISLGYVS